MRVTHTKHNRGRSVSDALHRGEHAKRILEDSLVREALETIKRETQGMFFALPSQASSEREFLHLMDRARQQFENYFQILIAGATVHRSEILAEDQMQARMDAIQARVRDR